MVVVLLVVVVVGVVALLLVLALLALVFWWVFGGDLFCPLSRPRTRPLSGRAAAVDCCRLSDERERPLARLSCPLVEAGGTWPVSVLFGSPPMRRGQPGKFGLSWVLSPLWSLGRSGPVASYTPGRPRGCSRRSSARVTFKGAVSANGWRWIKEKEGSRPGRITAGGLEYNTPVRSKRLDG